MPSFPLISVPGQVWPGIPHGAASQLWALHLELGRTQWLAPDVLLAGQLRQVRHLLEHCSQQVPYYADLLSRAAIEPADIQTLADFRRIPILSRNTYREHFAQLQARALPPGVTATGQTRTSGTTGVAVEVRQSNLVRLWYFAGCLRDMEWCGFDLRGTLAAIRNFAVAKMPEIPNGVEWPSWSPQLAPLLETGRCFAMDIQQDPRRQMDWLLRVGPDYLLTTPSNAVCLAGLLAASGRRIPRLRAIQVMAEMLTEEAQSLIEAGFGVPVKNLYSCMEAGYLASPCPLGHGLHVHAENVLFELLNENDEPCQPGETGRVVLTTLRNHVTPFVRYEISDTATLGPERCPCGRGLPLLTRIEGKVRPIFALPGGRHKASNHMMRLLLKLNAYQQHQVVQRAPDHFAIRVVPRGTWTPEITERIVRCVQEYVEAPVRVDVQVVERLELTASGKVRDVIVECAAPEEPGRLRLSARPTPRETSGPIVEKPRADFFRLRSIAGTAWPALPIGVACPIWSLYRELDRTQWLSAEEIADGQLAEVRNLLTHCVRNVPYYRELLHKARIDPAAIRTLEDFRKVPILKRSTWQQQFDQMKAVVLPPGVTKVGEANSSGSSGMPVQVWQTDRVNLWWLASSMRDMEWCGIDPTGKLASIRALSKTIAREAALAGVRSPHWHKQLHEFMETGNGFAMDVQQEPRRQLEWLMKLQPDCLLSYPSNLDFLANLLRESGQRIPRLKVVQAISEILTDERRARIESAFGVPLRNTYSCAEAGYLASPCPLGSGLHVHAENVLLEVVDAADRPCGPGQTGRVLLTTLRNHTTPFVRYDIGDTATLGPERCACGRGLTVLTHVYGKERPTFRLADGRNLSSSPLVTELRRMELCHQYQVVQKAIDHFVVRLIPNRHWTADSPSRMVRLVEEYVKIPVRVDVELPETLQGPGGKVRDVVVADFV